MPEFTKNHVTLLGRLTRDPETRSLSSGDQVATFSVATSDTWKDSNGKRQERSQFHPVVVWNQALIEATVPASQERLARNGRRRARTPQLRSSRIHPIRHRGRSAAVQRIDCHARPRSLAAGR